MTQGGPVTHGGGRADGRPPRPSRPPYWTLVLLAALLTLPFPWATGLIAAATVARVVWTVSSQARSARGAGVGGGAEAGAGAGVGVDGGLGPDAAIVPLGITPGGRHVGLSDRQLGAHGLIVGATGAGKSTTLLTILEQQIHRGRPAVVIDLKGSPAFADQLRQAAESVGRRLQVWTPDGPTHWNPLALGNATELKDKLLSTENFTEPHFERAAERYLQTVLTVLMAHGCRPQLSDVVGLMEPNRLDALARRLPTEHGERVQDYLRGMTPDQLSAVRGLGTRLAVLSESQAGPYLLPGPAASRDVNLADALTGGDVVLFSLNSARYKRLAGHLGTLAVQDLITATGHRLEAAGEPGALVAVDEFSALGSDHLLQLLARGREAGVSVIVATQEVADLDRAGRGFRDQVLGLTAVKIVHRQDVPGSALLTAQMAGTEPVWDETRQIHGLLGPRQGSRGTRRVVDRYLVDPNEVMALGPGQAIVLSKIPTAGVTRLQVTPAVASVRSAPRVRDVNGRDGWFLPSAPARRQESDRAPAAPASPPPRGIGDRDQPDPGLTR